MNRDAFQAILGAQRAYLLANGWVEDLTGWREPEGRRGNGRHRNGRLLDFSHAVNSQLYADRNYIEPPPPEPPELRRARLLESIRAAWPGRHLHRTYGSYRQEIRSTIRFITRELGEAGAITRVQKARLRRAQHAKHHKHKGCECGKEGAPY